MTILHIRSNIRGKSDFLFHSFSFLYLVLVKINSLTFKVRSEKKNIHLWFLFGFKGKFKNWFINFIKGGFWAQTSRLVGFVRGFHWTTWVMCFLNQTPFIKPWSLLFVRHSSRSFVDMKQRPIILQLIVYCKSSSLNKTLNASGRCVGTKWFPIVAASLYFVYTDCWSCWIVWCGPWNLCVITFYGGFVRQAGHPSVPPAGNWTIITLLWFSCKLKRSLTKRTFYCEKLFHGCSVLFCFCSCDIWVVFACTYKTDLIIYNIILL